MTMRIVQMSDTHLLADCEVGIPNTEKTIAFINETLRPDLVVHTGDLVGLDPDDATDRSAAATAMAKLEAPLLIVPGNHDVGDPGELPWMGIEVTSPRVAEHRRVFGDDRFSHQFGDWTVMGINSQLFGSDVPEEDEQWEWLERELATSRSGSILMFLHVPIWPLGLRATEDVAVACQIPTSARERLLALPGAQRIRAVGTGHLHWYWPRRRGSVLEVTAPAVLHLGTTRDDAPVFPQIGVVEWRLDEDRITPWFRAPTNLDERDTNEIPAMTARIEKLKQRLARTGGAQ